MAELSARMEIKTGTLPVSLGGKGVPGKYPRTRRESVAKPKKITSRIQRVVSAEAGGSMQGVCDPQPSGGLGRRIRSTRVILSYKVSSKPPWTTRDTVSKHKPGHKLGAETGT